jgi:1-deoxy-D-xylulose-5-phosphate reductoisomerase
MSPRRVTVLGSTGSVGVSTLALLAEARAAGRADFTVNALVGGSNVERLAQQALAFRPELTVIADETRLAALRDRLAGSGLKAAGGEAAVLDAASGGADWVMAAIVGAAGLAPTLRAARTGAVMAIANKESIVCSGPLLMETTRAAGGRVIPVDSEHSAIFQALNGEPRGRVSRLILTASGGPFRNATLAEMDKVTPKEALDHPVWSMGPKISLDSATLANKGLEMIEAAYLFQAREDEIDVIVHPQHIIHSMVEFVDGSTLAQLGVPDMRTPIAIAWSYPDRLEWNAPRLDLAAVRALDFEAPDLARFPMLGLARRSLKMGGYAPCAFNAANEVAGQAFFAGRIGFLKIATVVEQTLSSLDRGSLLSARAGEASLEAALEVDREARRMALSVVETRLEGASRARGH